MSKSRNVCVHVSVTDESESVRGLTAEDFIVLDDGVPQEIELVDIETVPLSVMLVLDTSGSVFGRSSLTIGRRPMPSSTAYEMSMKRAF
jgi:hypothetical protein